MLNIQTPEELFLWFSILKDDKELYEEWMLYFYILTITLEDKLAKLERLEEEENWYKQRRWEIGKEYEKK